MDVSPFPQHFIFSTTLLVVSGSRLTLKGKYSLYAIVSSIYIYGSTFIERGVRPEEFQFMEKGQNRNFDYKIVISVKKIQNLLSRFG